mmetsp:Transcript_17351/g.49551  ORF Transcript_17351/g.49551 Transcript_17351/m.49551 type:complete len:336 (+) Transcript_17351:93-1100(+)
MAFLSEVGQGFADEGILCHLTLKELVHLEVTHSFVQGALLTGNAWGIVLNRELKCITFNGSLCAGSTFRVSRREVKELVAVVSRVLPFADEVPVPLADVGALRELSRAVRRASTIADAHMAASGEMARVFLARFRFAQSTESMTVAPGALGDGRSSSEGPAEDADQKWCVSASLTFTLLRERPSSAIAVAASAAELSLRLAWRKSTVQLSLSQGNAEPDGIGTHPATAARQRGIAEVASCGRARFLAVDICALGLAPLLRVRCDSVRVNGPWQKACGLAGGAEFNHAKLAAALSPGLPCVFCVREGVGPQIYQAPKDAHALHLDAAQWTCALSGP